MTYLGFFDGLQGLCLVVRPQQEDLNPGQDGGSGFRGLSRGFSWVNKNLPF